VLRKVNHRGAAPGDDQLFGAQALSRLKAATDDLCWLLDRGYAHNSSLELVGNRYALCKRQRLAVGRSACSTEAIDQRHQRCLPPEAMPGRQLWLDGYNVLMGLEAALGGGVVLIGRDGCCRDVLGIHGSYHRVQETEPALRLIGATAGKLGVLSCRWWLDQPVSNSGRLRSFILDLAGREGWDWGVDLAMNPDRVLSGAIEVIATADSAILDQCRRWFNLSRWVVEESIPQANTIDFSGG
jgi:hypothetical protein